MKSNITAVVLTKNEEINISKCLEHLKWTDEVVVVDSGSADSTVQIAEKQGARVIVNIPDGKFYIADQRNWALDHGDINTEWVLFIDADEVVTDQLRDEIIERTSEASDTVGFRLCFKFIFLDRWIKHVSVFPTWHDRIVRLNKVRFEGKVWEHFSVKDGIDMITEPYLHYGFNNGIGAWIDRHQRYADWKAEQTLNDGRTWIEIIRSGNKVSYEVLLSRMGLSSPIIRFIYHYIIKRGFLDGYPGFIYSLMMGYYQFMIFLYLLEKRRRKEDKSF